MDNGSRNSPVNWAAEIPPHRWWRVGLAVGFLAAAAVALLVGAALTWVAQRPRPGPGETPR